MPRECFQLLAEKNKRADNCSGIRRTKEPSPMRFRASDGYDVHRNWVAIFSYAASLALSLAIWGGVLRAVGHLVK